MGVGGVVRFAADVEAGSRIGSDEGGEAIAVVEHESRADSPHAIGGAPIELGGQRRKMKVGIHIEPIDLKFGAIEEEVSVESGVEVLGEDYCAADSEAERA